MRTFEGSVNVALAPGWRHVDSPVLAFRKNGRPLDEVTLSQPKGSGSPPLFIFDQFFFSPAPFSILVLNSINAMAMSRKKRRKRDTFLEAAKAGPEYVCFGRVFASLPFYPKLKKPLTSCHLELSLISAGALS